VEYAKFREECPLCQAVEQISAQKKSCVIETDHSVVIVGPHQLYSGYCMVVCKTHIREMHDLPPLHAQGIFHDVMRIGAAIQQVYNPWKINYASLGNQQEHLHWHVFPRYESDSNHLENPWKNEHEFAKYTTTREQYLKVESAIRNVLTAKC
jgi:diadenosine tetraphosphate (Ap4A) HIT family hydrolase